MWFSVVSTLIANDTRHHSGSKMLWTHEAQPSESATSQSARFALVSEYVSSIHP